MEALNARTEQSFVQLLLVRREPAIRVNKIWQEKL